MPKIFDLAEARWKKDKVLGVLGKRFEPLTQRLVDIVTKTREEYETRMNDPNYQEIKDVLERQKQAAEELISSGHLQDPEWIKNNIHVLTSNEIAENEVYDWLNNYVKTPQGQANLAYALVNEAGGADNQMEIQLGSWGQLGDAGGWASWKDSHVQLGEESWQQSGDWNRNNTLPHEIRHVGQQDILNLLPREWALYHAGIVEADARLTEYCDGVTEGRNPNAEGYDESLKKVFEREILPYRDKFLTHTTFKTWDEFVKIKDSDPETYNKVMGRIKEVQFKAVLNNLIKTPLYQDIALWSVNCAGNGNKAGLRAWVEGMCDRQGMRFERIWPEVESMTTGKKEIPGMEGCFNADGTASRKGVMKYETNKIVMATSNEGWVVQGGGSSDTHDEYYLEKSGAIRKIVLQDGMIVSMTDTNADGTSCEYTWDADGNKSWIYKDAEGNDQGGGSIMRVTKQQEKSVLHEKRQRQIDNGKGLDNKLQDLQESQKRQFGNGKGIDDAIAKSQESMEQTQQSVSTPAKNITQNTVSNVVSGVTNSGRE